jgi:hypothetical protein
MEKGRKVGREIYQVEQLDHLEHSDHHHWYSSHGCCHGGGEGRSTGTTLTNADNDDKDWFFLFPSMFGLIRGRAWDIKNKANMDIRHTQFLNLSIFSV